MYAIRSYYGRKILPGVRIKGDPHEFESPVLVLVVDIHESRNLLEAGGTPGGEEVDCSGFSQKMRGIDDVASYNFV